MRVAEWMPSFSAPGSGMNLSRAQLDAIFATLHHTKSFGPAKVNDIRRVRMRMKCPIHVKIVLMFLKTFRFCCQEKQDSENFQMFEVLAMWHLEFFESQGPAMTLLPAWQRSKWPGSNWPWRLGQTWMRRTRRGVGFSTVGLCPMTLFLMISVQQIKIYINLLDQLGLIYYMAMALVGLPASGGSVIHGLLDTGGCCTWTDGAETAKVRLRESSTRPRQRKNQRCGDSWASHFFDLAVLKNSISWIPWIRLHYQ